MNNFANLFRNKLRKSIFVWLGANQDKGICQQTQLRTAMNKNNVPLTTINYHITKLKEVGLIDKYLKLTKKGDRVFIFMWKNEDESIFRAHNIQLLFHLIKCPSRFPDYFLNGICQPISNGKYRGLKTNLNNMKVMFYSEEKICCTLPDVFGDKVEDILSAVQLLVPSIISVLEEEFKGIKIDDYKIAKVQTMHIAILNSVYANSILLKGFTYEGKNATVDNSHNKPELELTNGLEGVAYIDKLLEAEKEFAKNQDKTIHLEEEKEIETVDENTLFNEIFT